MGCCVLIISSLINPYYLITFIIIIFCTADKTKGNEKRMEEVLENAVPKPFSGTLNFFFDWETEAWEYYIRRFKVELL